MTMLLTGAGPGVPDGPPLLTVADTDFYYALTEASGTRADSGPNGLTLTDVNTVGSETGKVGALAASFLAANSELLRRSYNAAQLPTNNFTITAWVKLLDKNGNAGTNNLVASWDVGGNYIISYEKVQDRFRFYLVDTALFANTFGAPSTGVWYFLVVQRSGTQIRISVNNGAFDTGTKTGNPSAAVAFAIGGIWEASTPAYMVNGAINQVAKWSRVLTADELTWLYNSGNGRALT